MIFGKVKNPDSYIIDVLETFIRAKKYELGRIESTDDKINVCYYEHRGGDQFMTRNIYIKKLDYEKKLRKWKLKKLLT